MAISLIIKNGTVVSIGGVMKTDVLIQGEKIRALGASESFPKMERVIDAEGKIVIPGGVDPHTHLEHPYLVNESKETWDVGTAALAIGGTTTTIDFAIQEKGKSLLDAVKSQFTKAEKLSAIDYTTTPILTDLTDLDTELDQIKEVIDYGVPSFKIYTIFRQRGLYVNDWQLYSILRRVSELGGLMTIHAENGLIGEEMQVELVKRGKTDPKYWSIAKPNFVENMDIQKIMMLAEELGTKTYIVHTSTREGPGIIDSYRKKGLPVFCETCHHYLWLTDETFDPKFPRGIMYMCSPPLRKQADIEALWEGVKAGTVHTVGSDHVAYTMAKKKENSETFITIPNGLPGCEVRVPIVFQEGVLKRGVSLERFVEVVSTNAAKIFGLYPKKGVIAPGSDADIVILDPDKKHSLNAADLHMGTDLSVFEGMEVTGWPVATILRGKVIAEDDKFTGMAGEGQFVKGKLQKKYT